MSHAIAIVLCSAGLWAMGLWSAIVGADEAALYLCGIGVAMLYFSVAGIILVDRLNR